MEREFFQNGITMVQSQALFRLGSDAIVLADFARIGKNARVCDLCAGAGAVGLLLLASHPDCHVTALELQESACRLARENVLQNGLEARMSVVQGDLREIDRLLPAGRFDHVVCNPPYFPVGQGKAARSPALAAARTEQFCTLQEVCFAASWLLKTGGSFDLVHRPERLADIFCALREAKLEPKRLRPVRHKDGDAPCLVLLRAVKGGKHGLQMEADLTLHRPDGSPSEEYRRIYHI